MNTWLSAYLAGPMRGIPRWNFDAFFAAAKVLRKAGVEIHSPAEHDIENGLDPDDYPDLPDWFTVEQAMQWDLARVAESDAIILLPGWEKSTGARQELQVARWCGRDAYEYQRDYEQKGDDAPGPILTLLDPADDDKGGWVTVAHFGQPVGEVFQPTVTLADYGDVAITTSHLGEKRVTDPVTGGMKGSKVARMDLLPWDALVDLSIHFGENSETHGGKYPDRNWEKGYKWSLGIASLARHLAAWIQGEEFDEEGHPHIRAIHWHASTLHAFSLRGAGTDDRQP